MTERRPHHACIVLLLVGSLSGSAQAWGAAAATPRQAVKLAKQHFKEAETHYRLGRFEAALTEYSLAYELKPLPAFLFNIAQCHMELKHYERAVFFYEGYLRDAVRPQNRALAEERLGDARQALDVERLEAERLAKAQTLEREQATERERLARDERERTLKAEEDRQRLEAERLALEKSTAQAAAIAAQQARPVAPSPPEPAFYQQWWFIAAASGVALAAASTTVYLMTRGNNTEKVLPSGDLGTIDARP